MSTMSDRDSLATHEPDAPDTAAEQPATEPIEMVHLTGRPTLRRFLRFVDRHAVAAHDPGALVEQWQAARDQVCRLQHLERALANRPRILKLGKEYEPLLIELLREPTIRNNFNAVPTHLHLLQVD